MLTPPRECLAVGFFDGVHLGHRSVLSGADAVLTFAEHPLVTLTALGRAKASPPALIMSREDRLAAIGDCGVRTVTALDFTPEIADLPAAEFASRYLSGRRVRSGANWRFGRGGEGDAAWLAAHGYDAEVVSYADAAGEPVSSTRIRQSIRNGDLAAARAMLGRAWSLVGRVFEGKHVGRTLGYPTVNLDFSESGVGVRPPRGVYAVRAAGVCALANWGVAPTAGERAWTQPVMEIHFPDGLPALPTAFLRVTPLAFLRPERLFESQAALKAQLDADLAEFRRTAYAF